MKFLLALASTLFVSPTLIDAWCKSNGSRCYSHSDCCSDFCVWSSTQGTCYASSSEVADKGKDIPSSCLDKKYEVYLHAVKGPHFALGAEAVHHDEANCPFAFAFYAGDGAKTINMYETKDEVPNTAAKIKLGTARLDDILLAEGSYNIFLCCFLNYFYHRHVLGWLLTLPPSTTPLQYLS